MGEKQWANYIIFGRTMSYCVTDPFHGQVGKTDQTNGEKMDSFQVHKVQNVSQLITDGRQLANSLAQLG